MLFRLKLSLLYNQICTNFCPQSTKAARLAQSVERETLKPVISRLRVRPPRWAHSTPALSAVSFIFCLFLAVLLRYCARLSLALPKNRGLLSKRFLSASGVPRVRFTSDAGQNMRFFFSHFSTKDPCFLAMLGLNGRSRELVLSQFSSSCQCLR
jgi:hypothetical protein